MYLKEIGFLKLDRKIMSWRWYKNTNTFRLFIHLLLCANFEKGEFEEHTIERGQVVTGLYALSCATGLSVQAIRTALKHLKSTNDITIKTTTKYSIITIVNYEYFQDATSTLTNEEQTSNKQATNEQQQYKNNKKNKKNNKLLMESSYSLEDFENKSMFKD